MGSRVLTQMAAGQAAADADVKALEAKIGEKLEVTAKQVIAAAAAFQKAMDEIAKAAAVPVINASAAFETAAKAAAQDLNAPPRAVRHRLPEERASITHKFSIAGHEGYITVGLYPDRSARRNLHQDGQGRIDRLRPDGCLCHLDFAGPAARRAAARAVREVCAHPL